MLAILAAAVKNESAFILLLLFHKMKTFSRRRHAGAAYIKKFMALWLYVYTYLCIGHTTFASKRADGSEKIS